MDKDEIILYLGIALGILSVVNKLLLLNSRTSGWASGMAIGILSSLYFYNIGLVILALAELGFFLVMLYGFLSRTLERPGNLMRSFNVVLTGILLGLSIVLFTGKLTVCQLISSLTFIWGGYALAKSWHGTGWSLFVVAHIATSIAAYLAGQEIFAGLQIASAVVSLLGLALSANRRRTLRSTAKEVLAAEQSPPI